MNNSNSKRKRVISVSCSIIINQKKILILKRRHKGPRNRLWEFPGGKQEPDESIESCIKRELKEELGIAVTVAEQLISIDHAYSHKKLRFMVHLCHWVSGEPRPLASQQVRWVKPEELKEFPFPAANARMIKALMIWLATAEA